MELGRPPRRRLRVFCFCFFFFFSVRGQPLTLEEATYEERTVTGVRGRAVELSCGAAAAAGPPAAVFWSFSPGSGAGPPLAVAVGSGREVSVAPGAAALGRARLRNGSLELRELRAAAGGRYLCQGLFPQRGRLRVGYAAVLLRVLVPVSKPFVRPAAAAAAEGASVALSCGVREGSEPLSFSWQHREPGGGPSVATVGLEEPGAELRLTPANRSHAGWYVCAVGNEVNNRSSEPVYLDIVYGPDQPAISMEPFSSEQGGFSAPEREDVVLSCWAPSNPPSRYLWFHKGSQVHVGPTYVVAAVARAQAGTYTCLAENVHLRTRAQATIGLNVYSESPFEAFAVVTAAMVTGMLVATVASVLALRWVAHHREALPRLHELLFLRAQPGEPEAPEAAPSAEEAPAAGRTLKAGEDLQAQVQPSTHDPTTGATTGHRR